MGDTDRDRYLADFDTSVRQFLDATRSGRKAEWLRERFGESYPPDSPDAEVIDDLRTDAELPRLLSVCECDGCGRLHIQVAPGVNRYRSFTPDEPGYAEVLSPQDAPISN